MGVASHRVPRPGGNTVGDALSTQAHFPYQDILPLFSDIVMHGLSTPTGGEITTALLGYLRDRLDDPALAYVEPPVRILGGFDTIIYAFRLASAPAEVGGPLILRLYRRESPPQRACFEGTVQNTLASLGYPAPRALLIESDPDRLSGAFIVMPRVPGRVMLEEFFRPRAVRIPGLLARAHVSLHALDPEPLRRALAESGCPLDTLHVDRELTANQSRIDAARLEGLCPGARWVSEHRPPEPADPVVCQGDFHPLNVLVDGGCVTGVIDWAQGLVRIADRAYDVGATVALLTHGPVALPGCLQAAADVARRLLVGAYQREYQRHLALDHDALRYYEALRCLAFLIEAGEHLQATAGVIGPVSKPTAFGAPRIRQRILAHFRRLSGVTLSLPDAE